MAIVLTGGAGYVIKQTIKGLAFDRLHRIIRTNAPPYITIEDRRLLHDLKVYVEKWMKETEDYDALDALVIPTDTQEQRAIIADLYHILEGVPSNFRPHWLIEPLQWGKVLRPWALSIISGERDAGFRDIVERKIERFRMCPEI